MLSDSPPPTPPPRPKQGRVKPRFVATSTPCERAEAYRPGGHHPVHIGDVFNQRYEVIRKLGYGSFATIWLAVDKESSRYVALKVVIADSSGESKELDIFNTISNHTNDDSDAANLIVKLLDSFTLQGPNGIHLCLVMEPMGINLGEFVYRPSAYIRYISVKACKLILKQILMALCFLHEHGIVHGDLQPGNILFTVHDIDSVPVEQLRQNETSVDIEPLQRLDGKVDKWGPRYLVVPGPLSEPPASMFHDRVKLSDFGEAFKVADTPKSVHTPVNMRPPELILGGPIGPAIDIWNLGCVLYQSIMGSSIVEMLIPPGIGAEVIDDEHLMQLTDILGPLPPHIYSKWSRSHLYFGENRERLPLTAYPMEAAFLESDEEPDELDEIPASALPLLPNLRDMFHKRKPESISDEEEEEIVELLQLILRYDPSERPTARELLNHPWFNN